MSKSKTERPFIYIAAIFFICFVFRYIEYIVIQTDRGIIGEAVIHKLLGMVVMAVALVLLRTKWNEIGFKREHAAKSIIQGLIIGALAFALAYGTEMILLTIQNQKPTLELYVTAYSIDGNIGKNTGAGFFLMCISGNIINVIMEEGIFRGLYLNLLEKKHSFVKSAVISSLMFGLWHVMAPLRSYLEGNMRFSSLIMACLMQIVTTALMGFMLCMLAKNSNNLYSAMAVHFVNNTIVNILHVVGENAADSMQFVRITIAQTLTFILVLILFIRNKKRAGLAAQDKQ